MTSIEATDNVARLPGQRATGRALYWFIGGWKLFRRAPLRLFGVIILMAAIEGLLQLSLAVAGVLLSKWVMGMISGLVWLMLDNLEQEGRLRPLHTFRQTRGKWPELMLLGLIMIEVFATQLGVACLLLGSDGFKLMVFMTHVPVTRLQLGVILAAGAPSSALLLFTAPRLLIERQSLLPALSQGIKDVLQHAAPISILVITSAITLVLAPVTFVLSALLTAPWLSCVGYAAYRDIGSARR